MVNVGDSRAYLFRDGSLRQLTRDHTVTADLVRRGALNEDDAAANAYRNVLTRALGVGRAVEVDSDICLTLPGDRLLLCTDGLVNAVAESEISTILNETLDVTTCAEHLVQQAVSNSAGDDVTAVVAVVEQGERAPAGAPGSSRGS